MPLQEVKKTEATKLPEITAMAFGKSSAGFKVFTQRSKMRDFPYKIKVETKPAASKMVDSGV